MPGSDHPRLILAAAILLTACGEAGAPTSEVVAQEAFNAFHIACPDSLWVSHWWSNEDADYLVQWRQPRLVIMPYQLSLDDSLIGVTWRGVMRLEGSGYRRYLKPRQRPGLFYPDDWLERNQPHWGEWEEPAIATVLPMELKDGRWDGPDFMLLHDGEIEGDAPACSGLPG